MNRRDTPCPPRPRTEHVGSLIRPPELVQLRMAALMGRGDPVAIAAAEDRAILAALQKQAGLGLDMVGDGELRRFSFMGEVVAAYSGFVPGELRNPDWFSAEGPTNPGSRAMVVAERLHTKGRVAEREATFLLEHSPLPFKITLPSPLVVAQACWVSELSSSAYPRRADLMWEVADLLRQEVELLAAQGVPCIQIDNPGLAYYLDPELRARSAEVGIELSIPLEEAVAADAHCLSGLPPQGGPLVGLHLCRGNWQSAWLAQGGYGPLAEQVFATPRVHRLLLEYDTERAGDFEPLRHVPEDRHVVLGLVSSKYGRLEDAEQLLRRIEDATRYVPLERLSLSPQCGFATSVPGNRLSEDEQWSKLELIVEVARRVWG